MPRPSLSLSQQDDVVAKVAPRRFSRSSHLARTRRMTSERLDASNSVADKAYAKLHNLSSRWGRWVGDGQGGERNR